MPRRRPRVDRRGVLGGEARVGGQVEALGEHGIAALGVRNIYHFAALWPEVTALAEMGLVASEVVGAAVRQDDRFVIAWEGEVPLRGKERSVGACGLQLAANA